MNILELFFILTSLTPLFYCVYLEILDKLDIDNDIGRW